MWELGLLLFASPTAGAGVGPWSSSLQPSQEATPSPGLTLFGCSLSCGGGKTQQQLCLDGFCRPELSVAGSVAFAGATLKRWRVDWLNTWLKQLQEGRGNVSIMVGKAWHQYRETAGLIVSAVKKQREMNAGAHPRTPLPTPIPPYGMVLPVS